MKTREFTLLALTVAVVIGAVFGFFVCRTFSSRFTLSVVKADAATMIVRMNTFTGKASVSIFNEGWMDIPDHAPGPGN
jgi:type II secretory pathway component PulJ